MTREEIDSLVHHMRETVEERIGVDLSPIAAIRLEQSLFEVLRVRKIFQQAERVERVNRGISAWK